MRVSPHFNDVSPFSSGIWFSPCGLKSKRAWQRVGRIPPSSSDSESPLSGTNLALSSSPLTEGEPGREVGFVTSERLTVDSEKKAMYSISLNDYETMRESK